MITVTIIKDSDVCRAFKVEGHAGYANKGRDIICSAVSVLTINCINSLEKLTDDAFSYEEGDGFVDFRFEDEGISKNAELLIDSFILGIQSISEENAQYIRLVFKEE